MTPKDLITIVLLPLGLLLITVMLVLIKRFKFKLEMWPRILGVGAGIYGFVSLMTMSLLLRPLTKLVDYTITNFLLSLAGGTMAYLGGRIIVRRNQDKN